MMSKSFLEALSGDPSRHMKNGAIFQVFTHERKIWSWMWLVSFLLLCAAAVGTYLDIVHWSAVMLCFALFFMLLAVRPAIPPTEEDDDDDDDS